MTPRSNCGANNNFYDWEYCYEEDGEKNQSHSDDSASTINKNQQKRYDRRTLISPGTQSDQLEKRLQRADFDAGPSRNNSAAHESGFAIILSNKTQMARKSSFSSHASSEHNDIILVPSWDLVQYQHTTFINDDLASIFSDVDLSGRLACRRIVNDEEESEDRARRRSSLSEAQRVADFHDMKEGRLETSKAAIRKEHRWGSGLRCPPESPRFTQTIWSSNRSDSSTASEKSVPRISALVEEKFNGDNQKLRRRCSISGDVDRVYDAGHVQKALRRSSLSSRHLRIDDENYQARARLPLCVTWADLPSEGQRSSDTVSSISSSRVVTLPAKFSRVSLKQSLDSTPKMPTRE